MANARFTTHHYQAIADIIASRDIEPANTDLALRRYAFVEGQANMRFQIVSDLIELFEGDNENFDVFLQACHIDAEQWYGN